MLRSSELQANIPRDRRARDGEDNVPRDLPAVLGLALGLLSYVPATAQSYLTAPADPKVRVKDPGYADVTAGVKTFEVTGPKDWIEQNRQVAPGGGQGGDSSSNRARRSR